MIIINRDSIKYGYTFSYNDDKRVSMTIRAGAYAFIDAINGDGF